MGSCLCKHPPWHNRHPRVESNINPLSPHTSHEIPQHRQSPLSPILEDAVNQSSINFAKLSKFVRHVDSLVMETLSLIKHLVDNDQQPPHAMLVLHKIADREPGWLAVVSSLVHMIPLDNPLGPAVITMLIDECPIPSKDAMMKLITLLKVSGRRTAKSSGRWPQIDRNICIVLGCLAEKLAGPSSVLLLTRDVMKYLIGNLRGDCHPVITLQAIVALEKFAQTSENKTAIARALHPNPLVGLERVTDQDDFIRQEVTFSAQWCLDNLFLVEGRVLSYHKVDLSNVSVMLNGNDVSEYLKISPDGLQARCDASSFESVRCTFHVDTGVWYYEVTVISAGVMQIGWATRDSKFLNHEGYGIGDDSFSVAYDGCRQLLWHEAHSLSVDHPPWKPGDVLGMLLDIDHKVCSFILNGKHRVRHSAIFNNTQNGFFAAASFMSFQQCRFNFGSQPFRYPPSDIAFHVFNDFGTLTNEEKVILPRQEKLALLQTASVSEHCCTICCDMIASIVLLPCRHSGFCLLCANQLEMCPVCRETIQERQEQFTPVEDRRSQRKVSNDSMSSLRISGSSSSNRHKDSFRRKSNFSLNNVNVLDGCDRHFGRLEKNDCDASFSDENNEFVTNRSFKIFDKDRVIYCEVCFMEMNACQCTVGVRDAQIESCIDKQIGKNSAEFGENSGCQKRFYRGTSAPTVVDAGFGCERGGRCKENCGCNSCGSYNVDLSSIWLNLGESSGTCSVHDLRTCKQEGTCSNDVCAADKLCNTHGCIHKCACSSVCACARTCGCCNCAHGCPGTRYACTRGCARTLSCVHAANRCIHKCAHVCATAEQHCVGGVQCSCGTARDIHASGSNMNRNITSTSSSHAQDPVEAAPDCPVIDDVTVPES